jgi:serine/threonine-protein kinase
VIHRDIKPGNILISKKGEVKLTDFGIAFTQDELGESDLTVAGDTLGTPAYMSPEQIQNSKGIDVRSDIYSLGVMLYEMTTGQKPFPGSYTPATIELISKGKFLPPHRIEPSLHPIVLRLIRKMMKVKAKSRFQDLKPVLAILDKGLKNYKDESAIRLAIVSYCDGKEEALDRGKKKGATSLFGRILKKVALFTGIGMLFAIGAYFGYRNGLHYEYLKAKEYGALKLSISFHKDYAEKAQRSIKASLYKKDSKNNFQEVKEINFDFQETKEGFAESRKNYLIEGEYRIKVYTPYLQYYEDFYLNARDAQKRQIETADALQIKFDVKALHPAFLNFSYGVVNRDNKEDLTKDTKVRVYFFNSKRWVDWEELQKENDFKESFITGRGYLFQFKKEDFYEHTAYITPQLNESNLNLQIKLTPVPGFLILNSNEEGMEVFLNRFPYYFSGGQERKLNEMENTKKKGQKFQLSPGEYLLSIRKSKTVSQNLNLEIKSNQTIKIQADYDMNQNVIQMKLE